jgi:hypothetical protein
MKTFLIYYSFIHYILQAKKDNLYRIWKEIGKKSKIKCQHVQTVVLSDINIENLLEEEVKNIQQSIYWNLEKMEE